MIRIPKTSPTAEIKLRRTSEKALGEPELAESIAWLAMAQESELASHGLGRGSVTAEVHPRAANTTATFHLQSKYQIPGKFCLRGTMKKFLLLTLLVSLSAFSFAADDQPKESKAADRVQAAADVLNEIQGAPDAGIPQEVLGSAECVAVVPSMLKGGFFVGGKYGRGLASCRTPRGWSAPAFFTVTGGSFGLQIGGQAVDLVMLIMNKDGMKHLLSSEFALGADASVAAGPVGRHAEGNTDWKMRAEVLTYSRARGLFAGITLNGAVIKQDKDSTREFYGRMVPFKTSLTGEIEAPPVANSFLTTLAKWAQEAAK
jgi:lipid-binding SYLF domain-containing protein